MIRMLMTIMLTAAALVALASMSARYAEARISPNGVDLHGISANAFVPASRVAGSTAEFGRVIAVALPRR